MGTFLYCFAPRKRYAADYIAMDKGQRCHHTIPRRNTISKALLSGSAQYAGWRHCSRILLSSALAQTETRIQDYFLLYGAISARQAGYPEQTSR